MIHFISYISGACSVVNYILFMNKLYYRDFIFAHVKWGFKLGGWQLSLQVWEKVNVYI